MAARMEDRFASWLKSIGLYKYAGQFAANGYDDLDLLTTLDTDEVKSMIETLGIGMKGHILKLEKSTHALQNPSSNGVLLKEKKPTDTSLVTKKPEQTKITLSGRKFVIRSSEGEEHKPWAVFLKPNPKTEKMKYFNEVTEEIYRSSYVEKQNQFISYLNGQRQFRWNIKQKIAKLESVMQSYGVGIIPKENIFFHKYLTPPIDVSLKDLSFANRAVKHIIATRETADDVLELLHKRKVQLFNNQMEVKKWAANEHKVITDFIVYITPIKEKLISYENNVAHTAKIFAKKYGSTMVSNFEVKRQRKRQKEQKSQSKKKRKVTLLRNSRALLSNSNFKQEEIDEICPNIYRMRSAKIISTKDITQENVRGKKKSICYLHSISAFREDDMVISSSESEDTDSDSSQDPDK